MVQARRASPRAPRGSRCLFRVQHRRRLYREIATQQRRRRRRGANASYGRRPRGMLAAAAAAAAAPCSSARCKWRLNRPAESARAVRRCPRGGMIALTCCRTRANEDGLRCVCRPSAAGAASPTCVCALQCARRACRRRRGDEAPNCARLQRRASQAARQIRTHAHAHTTACTRAALTFPSRVTRPHLGRVIVHCVILSPFSCRPQWGS